MNPTLFLQASGDGLTIGIIVVYFVIFLIAVLITRAIFSIDVIVNNLKAQTKLLANIAEKAGVDPDVIKKHLYAAINKTYKPKKEKPVK